MLDGFSQQVPLYSQYMLNGFLLNPAVAGSEGYTAVNLTAREDRPVIVEYDPVP